MLFSINSLVFVFEFRPRSTPFVFILFPSNKYSSFLLTCTSAHFLTNTPSGSLNPTFDAQILQTKRKLSFLLLSNAICIKNNHLRMPFYKVVSGRSKILKPRHYLLGRLEGACRGQRLLTNRSIQRPFFPSDAREAPDLAANVRSCWLQG